MQSKVRKTKIKIIILTLIALIYIAICMGGIDRLYDNETQENETAIENSIKKAALECYALEGSFPPRLQYLQDNYGVIVNENLYFYHYQPNGSNLMPDIKVIKRWQDDEN